MKAKLARGAIWIAATRGAMNLIGFASTILLARLLVPEDFGLVAIAMTVIAIVTSVTEVSLSTALVQHREPTDEHYHTAFTLGVIRAFVVATITATLAWPMAALYGDDRLVALILALAAGSAIAGLGNPKLVDLLRALVFRQEFLLGVSNKLIGFVVAATIAYIWRSYWALAAAMIASQLCYVMISYLLVRYRPRLSLAKTRELLSFSVWLTLSGIVSTLNYRFDTLIVGYFLGKTPLGYYSYGDNLASMVTREAMSPITQTLFPAFSRLNGDLPRLCLFYQRSQTLLNAAALPLGFGFAILAEPLVLATVGAKWLPAVIVIQVLSGVFAVQTLASSVQPLAMAMGETRLLFNVAIFNFLIRLPLIIGGIATAGLPGLLYARICSGLIGTLINMALARRLLDLSFARQLKVNLRNFGAAATMCAAVMLGPFVLPGRAMTGPIGEMAVVIAIGGVTYLTTLMVLWLAAGKPDGPEAEVLGLIRRFRARLSQIPEGGAAR